MINRGEKWRFRGECLVLFVAVLWFCLSGVAVARTFNVPGDYEGIQEALNAAKRGDTVRVSEGTYFENVELKEGVVLQGGWDKGFSRRDVSAHATVLDGEKKGGWVVLGADDATIDGFTILHATRVDLGDDTVGAGIHCDGTSPRIVNNTLRENAPAGIYCNNSTAVIMDNVIVESDEAGIYLEDGCDVTIQGNVIRDNKMAGIGSGGILESQLTVRNNTIYDNGMAGIDGRMATGVIQNNLIYGNQQGGIRCVKVPFDILNNTIVGNIRSGVVLEDSTQIPTVKNNILAYNDDAGIRSFGDGYSYNLFFSNNATGDCDPRYLWCVRRQYGGYEDEDSYSKNHDIIADPLFVDLTHHDYHLKAGSPGIDAGDPDPKYNDRNFPSSLGGERNDLGAYGGPLAVSEKRPANEPPHAQAGPSQEVYVGERVILDGRQSSDPNGDLINYQWKFVSRPKGSKAAMAGSKGARAGFKADVAGSYSVQLIVTDRWGKSGQPHTLNVTALDNHPPKANAGELISNIYTGDVIKLYGGGSKDPDGDPLSYRWRLAFRPAGSRAVLADAESMSPSFSVDALGCYAVELTVNDGKLDSEPDTVYVSTQHRAKDGKRNVPSEYPTIQTAIDAAEDGDDIYVQAGTYKENIIVDKSVDLIGQGWPTIDGGSKEGNTNTVMIPYLGDKAGRIEGFLIVGGGKGPMGHGINVWDSSPEIVGNKITGCHHNAIGIHGRAALTGKCKVYDNDIYGNTIGIGNGRGSRAHIYNNRIYDNRVVGVGSRGLAGPRIEANDIYGNRLGVGVREVASPRVEANRIYDNVCGVVVSPISTVRRFAGEDVVMKNNLIFANHQVGISVTSFNLSRVVIMNNTIDANNQEFQKDERAGGIAFGYPHQGEFTAVVENNILTSNVYGNVVNYTGTELFPFPGVTIEGGYNNVWNAEGDAGYVGCTPGNKDLSKDPAFTRSSDEKAGGYYLSQRAAGQSAQSPCVDAGNVQAAKAGLSKGTTRTDRVGDSGVVDLGYHYPVK